MGEATQEELYRKHQYDKKESKAYRQGGGERDEDENVPFSRPIRPLPTSSLSRSMAPEIPERLDIMIAIFPMPVARLEA